MARRTAKKADSRNFRLSFGGTNAKKWAGTKKAAKDDATYWVNFGQMRVCVEQALPSGGFKAVGCMVRPTTGRSRKPRWQPA